MTDLRHAGMGWSNGPIDGGNGRILSLPSPDLLMLGSEHWHYDEAVRAGKRVLFRGMARQGFRPAELGWNVKQYVDEILRDAVLVTEPITDFVGWNEWNLRDERGDQRPDDGDLTTLFTLLGGFQFAVLTELRKRPVTKHARLHFGAWAPKDETDYVEHWRAAAELADVVDVHAYGAGPGILAHADTYRALFPSTPIELTEWHSDFDGPDTDRDTLGMLANYAAVHQGFRAYYFLYRWFDPPAHQRDLANAIAVEGNPERYDLFRDPPTVQPQPAPEPIVMSEIEQFIRDAAQKRGINPDVAVMVAKSEGGVDEPARRGTFATGSSWWPFQIHYGGAGYEQYGTTAGMGTGFTALTGWQPGDPAAWRDSVRYALNRAKASGWGAWYGAAHVGVSNWYGIDRNAPWEAASEPWDYEALGKPSPAPAPAPKVTYTRDEPAIPQNDPWSCAPTSTRWALTALGRRPSEAWMESQMLQDGVVTREQGLSDASGQQLAAWITAQYGEFGYSASAEPATFDGLAAEFLAPSNPYPGLLGGRAWGHWSGLRSYDPASDRLLLANPAEGWMGIGQSMSRDDFHRLGSFSLVRIIHPDLLAPAPPVVAPAPPVPEPAPAPKEDLHALIAEIRALLDRLERAV